MKYVILSFDDGAKDFYNRAFKILRKYSLPAVLNIISDYAKTNETNHVSWDEIKECNISGIEIANHSAKHTNDLEDIIRGAKDIQENLGTIEKVGFASPRSEVCEKNFDLYQSLLISDHTAYIRSGNQVKRDGYFHALLYLAYKYTGLKKIFFWYNRRNIIMLNKKITNIFPSITCNCDNTIAQVLYLIEKMPNNSACIIMFHHVLGKDDDGYRKVKWSNTIEDFECLCDFLSEDESVTVITHKKLYEMMNNDQCNQTQI